MDQSADKSAASAVGGKSEAVETKEAELLQAFYGIPNIDKAWTSSSRAGSGGVDVVVAMSQANLHANAKRSFISTVYIPDVTREAADFHWSPFPFELNGALLIAPSPTGTKLLIVRKADPAAKEGAASAVKLEIWGPGQLLKELFVPASVHGSVYADGWFEGVAWSHDEERVAYVAEEPLPARPLFGQSLVTAGQSSKGDAEADAGTWKGQGDWVEDWGESYTGKRRPALFVASLVGDGVQAVEGIPKNISVGQVVWAPPPRNGKGEQLLVYVGWTASAGNFSTTRKLGMKYCYNRPCALYAVETPSAGRDASEPAPAPVKVTGDISSALTPRFSPDGQLLAFLSAKAAVDSGSHCATNSLHAMSWSPEGVVGPNMQIKDVVPVVNLPDPGGFPGLYVSNLITQPWLSDGATMLLSSAWGSSQAILAVNFETGAVTRISPTANSSWTLLGLQDDVVVAVSSSPISPPSLKLGNFAAGDNLFGMAEGWNWSDIAVPSLKYHHKVEAALSSMTYDVLKIPVPYADQLKVESEGGKQPYEAIFVTPKASSSKPQPGGAKKPETPPLVVVLHGGPHAVTQTIFSRTSAFLSALGYSLLHVNYRGSLGYGEDALQSLPGHVGRQDVTDVLTALEKVVSEGLADRHKIAVVGGSHGGFLTSHLIGQAPDTFVTAILRNPVCNISSMVGVTDIPDWCYVETFGREGLSAYTEAPSVPDLAMFYKASPVAHLSKVKVPTLFLLGAQDRRVPVSNGFQYVQALRARGLEVKVILFPEDIHAIDKPQSEFESFLNMGTWLKRFL